MLGSRIARLRIGAEPAERIGDFRLRPGSGAGWALSGELTGTFRRPAKTASSERHRFMVPPNIPNRERGQNPICRAASFGPPFERGPISNPAGMESPRFPAKFVLLEQMSQHRRVAFLLPRHNRPENEVPYFLAETRYPEHPKTWGEHIRKSRLDRNMTQLDAANEMRVTESSVWNWSPASIRRRHNASPPSLPFCDSIPFRLQCSCGATCLV